jgi:hypothetical protein
MVATTPAELSGWIPAMRYAHFDPGYLASYADNICRPAAPDSAIEAGRDNKPTDRRSASELGC